MGAQVDDLVEQIRAQADAHLKQQNPETTKPNGAAELDRLRANLAIARRAHDRLPPLTSNRHGRIARFELWIKQGLKRATHWFTWEQTNFNAATSASLANIVAILSQVENDIAELRQSVDRHENVTDGDGRAQIAVRLADIETQLRSLVAMIESRESPERLREEQRVCFSQLELQINEAAVISDRAKRSFQAQLDALARRLDELEKHPEENSI